MRVLSALVFASLSLSTFSLASPLENQVVLLDKELVEEPHWKYSLCGTSPSRSLVILSHT